MMKIRNALKTFHAQFALQTTLTVVEWKISDSDLPSKASEPRTGWAIAADEHSGRNGLIDKLVSGLKRGEGVFQFLS